MFPYPYSLILIQLKTIQLGPFHFETCHASGCLINSWHSDISMGGLALSVSFYKFTSHPLQISKMGKRTRFCSNAYSSFIIALLVGVGISLFIQSMTCSLAASFVSKFGLKENGTRHGRGTHLLPHPVTAILPFYGGSRWLNTRLSDPLGKKTAASGPFNLWKNPCKWIQFA